MKRFRKQGGISMRYTPVAILLCLLLTPSAALAGGFCCQIPTGVQEGYSQAGDVSVGVTYSYSRMSNFLEGGDQVSLSTIESDPRFATMGGVIPESHDMQRITLLADYAATDRLSLDLAVPYVINDMTMLMYMPGGMGMPGTWMREKMPEVSGLGDVTLTGYYRVYQDSDRFPRTTLSLGAGVKFPTGRSTVAFDGEKVHAHLQPGTGSWDPILAALFTDMIGRRFLIQASARYEIATSNGLGYHAGDTFAFSPSVKYSLTDYLNLSLGLEYFHAEQADDPQNAYNGQDSARLTDYAGYTGEDSIWVSPGIQVLPFKGASVDFTFQYPVYCRVPDTEQVTDYRIIAGASYSF